MKSYPAVLKYLLDVFHRWSMGDGIQAEQLTYDAVFYADKNELKMRMEVKPICEGRVLPNMPDFSEFSDASTQEFLGFIREIRHSPNLVVHLQLLPKVILIIEPSSALPFRVEAWSDTVGIYQITHWLNGTASIRHESANQPFGFRVSGLFSPNHQPQPDAVAREAIKHREMPGPDDFPFNPMNLTETPVVVDARIPVTTQDLPDIQHDGTGNIFEIIGGTIREHVEASAEQPIPVVPMNPADAPIPQHIQDLIDARAEMERKRTSAEQDDVMAEMRTMMQAPIEFDEEEEPDEPVTEAVKQESTPKKSSFYGSSGGIPVPPGMDNIDISFE